MGNPYFITGPALISFSGGRTSGYMLKHILDAHRGTLPDDVHVCFANTGREMPETLDFVQECSERWGVRIVWLEYDPEAEHKTAIVTHNSASRNGEPFAAVIEARKMLPNPVMRFCTTEMKIRRMKEYMHRIEGYDRWANIVGLRADEAQRVGRLSAPNRQRWESVAPLASAGVTKRVVQNWWEAQPFDLQLRNVNGTTPDGNCDLCFLKGEALIRGIIRERPELANWWSGQERARELSLDRRPLEMARFRKDRPSYAEMLDSSQRQGDLIDLLEGETLDCACTD